MINFIENWIVSYGFKYKYKDLPECGKLALKQYYEEESGEIELQDNGIFGYCLVPMEVLTKKIESVNSDYSPFEEYHKDYIRIDVENHGDSIWAVILENDIDITEVIFDGWHRFHDYYRRGIKLVPCVVPYFGEE